MLSTKSRFIGANILNIYEGIIHRIALWHIDILMLPETNLNLL